MKKKVNPKVMNMIDKWGCFFLAAYGILTIYTQGRKKGSRFEKEHCHCGKGQGENR